MKLQADQAASGSVPDTVMSEAAAERTSAASADLEDGWMQFAEELKAKRAKRGEIEDEDVDILELGVTLEDFDETTLEGEDLEGAIWDEDIDPELLKAARDEELDFMKTIEALTQAALKEAATQNLWVADNHSVLQGNKVRLPQ